MMKIAPEGKPFIAFFFVCTLLALPFLTFGQAWGAVPVVALVLFLFMVYFFRDPERIIPLEPGFISPADGKVIIIKPVDEELFLKRKVMKISIFMSPLNVHVNRAPCDGEVMEVKHTPGTFKAAWKDEASWKNENTAMVLRCSSGGPDILVRQVAGFLARRIVCRVGVGAKLKRGERYGMIKFSSRLDVYLPVDADVKVKIGDMVAAGETLLATDGGTK